MEIVTPTRSLPLLMLFACGPALSQASPTSTERRAAPVERTNQTQPEPCATIGYERPFTPTDEERRQNRAALRHHENGNYAEAAEGWSALVEESPNYTRARFNLACAMARVGTYAEAMEELERVLCEDLPTYGPRLADEDLADIREPLASWRSEVLTQYERAYDQSDTVVARGESAREGASMMWAQAARSAHGRLVPIGPRAIGVTANEYQPAMATATETEDGVVTVTSAATNADDSSAIAGDVSIVFTRSGTGEEIARWESRDADRRQTSLTRVVATTRGQGDPGLVVVSWWAENDGGGRRREELLRDGQRVASTAPADPDAAHVMPSSPSPLVHVSPLSLSVTRSAAGGWALEGTQLVRGDVRFDLPRPHRQSTSAVVTDVSGQTAYVLFVARHGCEAQGRYVLDVIDLESGESLQQRRGAGEATIRRGARGALMLEIGSQLYRYESPREAGAPEALFESAGTDISHSVANWGCDCTWCDTPRSTLPTN